MFGKQRCNRCGEKVGKDYNFCPYCRTALHEEHGNNNEDWGLLGKNDSMEPSEVKLPVGFNALFNSLLKNFDKQFKEMERDMQAGAKKDAKNSQQKKPVKGGISISISTANGRAPEIKVTSFGNQKKNTQSQTKKKPISLPSAEAKKFTGLQKQEPKTNIRRLANKVVYEIDLPGVKSLEDISVIQLESSIEIKALAKGKVFYKIIPIGLPITSYELDQGKLVLELDSKE